jgi:hypothetical protein
MRGIEGSLLGGRTVSVIAGTRVESLMIACNPINAMIDMNIPTRKN